MDELENQTQRAIPQGHWFKIVVRGLLVLTPVAVVAWLIWRDFAPNGQLFVANDLKHYHPYISSLYPLGRLGEPVAIEGVWKRQVNAEPVYFDVRLPRRMEQARVRLLYQTNGPSPRLGLKIGQIGNWSYDLQSLSTISMADNWTAGEVIFRLAGAAVEDGSLRFMISAPTVNDQGIMLEVRRVEVTLIDQPLQLADLRGIIGRKAERFIQYVRQP